jgi:hypothetical protein
MRIQFKRLALLHLALLICQLLASCEEIVDPEGLPYEEKLVIHSILFADSSNNEVRISRTLPLNVRFDSNQAFLRDAVGSISDGSTSYPLEYTGKADIFKVKGFIPDRGKEYTLEVSWRGLTARATTRIPAGASIDSLYLRRDTVYETFRSMTLMTVCSIPHPYSASFGILAIGEELLSASWSYRQHDRRDALTDGKVYVPLHLSLPTSRSDVDSVVTLAYVMSEGYRDYYDSRSNGSDEFGNPVPVRWNVEGDAIGIFFGCEVIGKTFPVD